MPKKSARARFAVGLISGTSMDGVDAALVEIRGSAERPRVKLRVFESLAYPEWLRQPLLDVAAQKKATAGGISTINFVLGKVFAGAANSVVVAGGVSPKQISVIGSHGQTVYHQGRPEMADVTGRCPANTFQIAEPAVIAEMTGIPVVADFRTADIAAGGEGAPLVPMVDYLLLRDVREDAEKNRIYLPAEDLARFAVSPGTFQPRERFVQLMRFEADRAWRFYEEGVRLLDLVSADSRSSLWTLIRIYSGILAKIESIHYDVLAKPHPGLSNLEKAWIMLRAGTGLWKPGLCPRHT